MESKLPNSSLSKMQFVASLFLVSCICTSCIAAPNVSSSSGASILAAAKSQIGVPYSSGGGTIHGKSYGVESGKRIKGFDCAGLAQFAVYNGTGKVISRDVANQYTDRRCSRVPYDQRKQGDLVFFEVATFIHHVGIVASTSTMIHSPHSGDHVREASIYTTGLVRQVQRCF